MIPSALVFGTYPNLKGKAQAQLYQRSFVELEKQTRRLEDEQRELLHRVNYLTDEVSPSFPHTSPHTLTRPKVVLEKRLGIAQLCLLLTVLVFMALTRGSRGEYAHPPGARTAGSMREWGRRTLSLSGELVNRLRTRSSTPPRAVVKNAGGACTRQGLVGRVLIFGCHQRTMLCSPLSGARPLTIYRGLGGPMRADRGRLSHAHIHPHRSGRPPTGTLSTIAPASPHRRRTMHLAPAQPSSARAQGASPSASAALGPYPSRRNAGRGPRTCTRSRLQRQRPGARDRLAGTTPLCRHRVARKEDTTISLTLPPPTRTRTRRSSSCLRRWSGRRRSRLGRARDGWSLRISGSRLRSGLRRLSTCPRLPGERGLWSRVRATPAKGTRGSTRTLTAQSATRLWTRHPKECCANGHRWRTTRSSLGGTVARARAYRPFACVVLSCCHFVCISLDRLTAGQSDLLEGAYVGAVNLVGHPCDPRGWVHAHDSATEHRRGMYLRCVCRRLTAFRDFSQLSRR